MSKLPKILLSLTLLLMIFNGIVKAQIAEPFTFNVESKQEEKSAEKLYICRQKNEKEGCRIELKDQVITLELEKTIKTEFCWMYYELNLDYAIHDYVFEYHRDAIFPKNKEIMAMLILKFDDGTIIRKAVEVERSGQLVKLRNENMNNYYQANHGDIDAQTYLTTLTTHNIIEITYGLEIEDEDGIRHDLPNNYWKWTLSGFKTAPTINAMLQRIVQEQEKLGETTSNSNSGGNSLSNGAWRKQLKRVMEHPTQNLSNGKYKGQTASTSIRYGLGVYWWTSDYCYWGEWKHNEHIGYAIDIASENHNVDYCPDCVFFVGNYADGGKSGKGKCYDKDGNLIYYGDFFNDRPTGVYPSKERYSKNKFECIEYKGGGIYIGETYNGQRHGQGVYLWKNGDAWYGHWEADNRNGYGIYLYYNGDVKYGYSKD